MITTNRKYLSKKSVTVYSLAHPETKEVFYIGRTSMSLVGRLCCHMTNKAKWNKQYEKYMEPIRKKGIPVIIEELDTCAYDDRKKVEEYWIQQFATWGFKLMNVRHNRNKNYIPHTRFTEELSEEERRLIFLLNRPGDCKIIAKRVGLSEEMVRLNRQNKRMPRDVKHHIIAFYLERAKEISDWYNKRSIVFGLKVA